MEVYPYTLNTDFFKNWYMMCYIQGDLENNSRSSYLYN